MPHRGILSRDVEGQCRDSAGVAGPVAGINVADIDWGAEAVREAVRSVHAPDVALTTLASGLGTGVDKHYRGLDDLVRYLDEWLEPFSEYHLENHDYIEAGDYVLVPSRHETA